MDYLGQTESLCLPKDTDSITFHLQEYFKYFTATLSINITAILHLVFYITGCPFGYKYKKNCLGLILQVFLVQVILSHMNISLKLNVAIN